MMKVEARFYAKSRKPWAIAIGIVVLATWSALVVWPSRAKAVAAASERFAVIKPQDKNATTAPEIVVYVSEISEDGLYELDFSDDAASPNGKMLGLRNTGDKLDPPPENDPHAKFKVNVQSGVAYRCWVHMKVGAPKGKSQANKVWVQFSNAVDKSNKEILKPGTSGYLTGQGPVEQGWVWVKCGFEGASAGESLVYFRSSGEVTVRIQAGMEGVNFDQFILSPARYLENAPTEAIVKK